MDERNDRGAAPAAGLDPIHAERGRIRAAMKVRCGMVIFAASGRGEVHCGLNLGHIGGCSQTTATLTVTKQRLEEILDG